MLARVAESVPGDKKHGGGVRHHQSRRKYSVKVRGRLLTRVAVGHGQVRRMVEYRNESGGVCKSPHG